MIESPNTTKLLVPGRVLVIHGNIVAVIVRTELSRAKELPKYAVFALVEADPAIVTPVRPLHVTTMAPLLIPRIKPAHKVLLRP